MAGGKGALVDGLARSTGGGLTGTLFALLPLGGSRSSVRIVAEEGSTNISLSHPMDIQKVTLYSAGSTRAGAILPSIAIVFSIIVILAAALTMVS